MPCIVPIVEGDGDMKAVPLLLRMILQHHQWFDWSVAPPKKARGLSALKRKLGSFIRYAEKERDCSAILILLDLDDGCPRDEACDLADRVRQLRSTTPIAVAFAHREYEAWFLASLATIAGSYGLSPDLVYDGDVEGRRGVKEWLTRQMPRGQGYKETIHQVKFTSRIDLDHASCRSRSFRRLCHAVEQLVQAADIHHARGYVTPGRTSRV